MKTNKNNVKEFDTVETFRKIKEKISQEIEGMSFEELKKYLAQKPKKANA